MSAPAEVLTEKLREAAALYHSGRLTPARLLYEEILGLQPRHVDAMHQLAVIAGRSGNFERAAELLGRVVEMAPERAHAANDLGVALKSLERWEAALACYDRAIALQPDYPEAHNNRGNLLRRLGDAEAALRAYDSAIAARPRYAEAHNNRGLLLADLHRWRESLAGYDRAIEIRPGYANAHCNRGVPLEHLDRLEAALASYDRAIEIDPTLTQAHVNRGNVLRQLQRAAEARESCDRALALRPDDAQAHLNKALALLTMGDFANGWREYEWRWRSGSSPLSRRPRDFVQPLWLGHEPVAGRTVLVHSEQGLGDTLQFCRYVPLVAELGAKIVFEVQPPLTRLLAQLDGVSQIIAQGDPLPEFDCHCPLLSLPLALGTTVSSIPARIPYLRGPADRRAFWEERLGPRSKPRVGLVWSGGFRPDQPEVWSVNDRRNIPLRRLAPLNLSDIEFHSLQKGEPAESELADLAAGGWDGPAVIDSTALLYDFSETAALIERLDLVISVDTSTAHLAGAMGKPVWILDRYDACWRWMGRVDSPWYPTATLYRQERRGDWSGVVARVRADLTRSFR
jgi:tetratricopeptide (TPR) repeat protein